MTHAPGLTASLCATRFEALSGWKGDDHGAAFAAFRLSAPRILEKPPRAKMFGLPGEALIPAANAALSLPSSLNRVEARSFFERWFTPAEVVEMQGTGFVTGYYEPVVQASRTPSPAFAAPLHSLPPCLAEMTPEDDRTGLDPDLTWAVRMADGRLFPHPDRGAIMQGALTGQGLEIAYVADWVEAFFIHVQGSARLLLEDGTEKRLTFAGKSGHSYFPIARVLVERGLMTAAEATADVLRAYLKAHPREAPAIMARNRSYIFFREAAVDGPLLGPIGAAGVPLTPGRSLAIDRHLHPFHLPIFVSADIGERSFKRLMIAQDTGSAIRGASRGDIFFGSGEAAFRQAAGVRHAARFTLLLPRGTSDGL